MSQKKCSILSAKPNVWSEQTRAIAIMAMDQIRPRFVCGENQIKGARFYSDVTGIWALTSTYTEDEFKAAGFTCAFNALDYLAGSDHWYKYRKDWGEHD